MSRLPAHDIPSRDRVIVPLDVPSHDDALALVDTLGDAVSFYKVGLQLALAGDYRAITRRLVAAGKHVFLDFKLYDIPNTVASAVAQLGDTGARFVTVHGDDKVLDAAVGARDGIEILAVTVLTSFDQDDLRAMGYGGNVADLVTARAGRALELGCDGIVTSGLEVERVRAEHGDKLLVVVPGVRPAAAADDQKRVVTPEGAIRSGADHLVIGRPIRDDPDPRAAAERVQAAISGALESA